VGLELQSSGSSRVKNLGWSSQARLNVRVDAGVVNCECPREHGKVVEDQPDSFSPEGSAKNRNGCGFQLSSASIERSQSDWQHLPGDEYSQIKHRQSQSPEHNAFRM
jgi:hypothetical protein